MILLRSGLVCLLWTLLWAPALGAAAEGPPGDEGELLQLREQVRAELADPKLAAEIGNPQPAISASALERQQILSRTELTLTRHLETLERAARPRERLEAIRRALLGQLEEIEGNAPVDIETVDSFLSATLNRARSAEAARTLLQLATAHVEEARGALDAALLSRRQVIEALKKAQQRRDDVDRRLRDMALADARVREMRVTLESVVAERGAAQANLQTQEQLAALARRLAERAVELAEADERARTRVTGVVEGAAAEARRESRSTSSSCARSSCWW